MPEHYTAHLSTSVYRSFSASESQVSGWHDEEPVEYARGGMISTAYIKELPKVLEISHKREVRIDVDGTVGREARFEEEKGQSVRHALKLDQKRNVRNADDHRSWYW